MNGIGRLTPYRSPSPLIASFALVLLLLFPPPASAGLYSPDEPFYFEIDANGLAEPIQYAKGFELFVRDYRDLTSDLSRERPKYLERIARRQAKGPSALSPAELAGLTSDLIRVNRLDEAINILQPLARDPRRGGFFVSAHAAVAHASRAGRGERREAADHQQMALRHAEFPKAVPGRTATQLAWLKRVEEQYYWPLLARRADEERQGRDAGREQVDAIFPGVIPPRRPEAPIQFVAEDGQYKAGELAAREKAKLPGDAIAIVQQILLWHPRDARLMWLLAELYNAEGEIETAVKIMDDVAYTMGFPDPAFREHRRVLRSAVNEIIAQRAAEAEKARAAKEAEEAERLWQATQARRRKVWIISIGVALGLLLVYYQIRELQRRLRRI